MTRGEAMTRPGDCKDCARWVAYRDADRLPLDTGVCQLRMPPYVQRIGKYPETRAEDFCGFWTELTD